MKEGGEKRFGCWLCAEVQSELSHSSTLSETIGTVHIVQRKQTHTEKMNQV